MEIRLSCDRLDILGRSSLELVFFHSDLQTTTEGALDPAIFGGLTPDEGMGIWEAFDQDPRYMVCRVYGTRQNENVFLMKFTLLVHFNEFRCSKETRLVTF